MSTLKYCKILSLGDFHICGVLSIVDGNFKLVCMILSVVLHNCMTGHVPVFGNVSPLTAERVSTVAFLCARHFFCICSMTYGGLHINNTLCVTTLAVRFFIRDSVFLFAG